MCVFLSIGKNAKRSSAAENEHRRRFPVGRAGEALLAPLGDGARLADGALQAQAGADGKPGVWTQVLQQGLPQAGVAVGRFDEDLRLAAVAAEAVELLDARGALAFGHGQIARECEVLPVQPGGGQRHQQ